MKLLAVVLLSSVCLSAAAADIDAVIADARNAPPEFAADALLRVAALDKLERPRRMELIEQAFKLAAGAQQAYKRHAAPLRLEGPVGYLNRANEQGLDALSLRLRAVEAMLLLDAPKARELFQQIPPVRPPVVPCDEFLLFDVSHFYDVLGALAQQSFSAKEMESGAPAKFLQSYAGSLTSPVQVAPMAKVLTAASNVKTEDFRPLLTTFGTALGKMAGDDRSFTTSNKIGPELQPLVAESKRRGITPLPLLENYRYYLVVNLSARRCSDNDMMQGGGVSFGIKTGAPAEQTSSDFAGFFNQNLRMDPLQPIREEESVPARLEGAAIGLRFCQEAECHALAQQNRTLLFGPNGTPYTLAERNSPEWQEKLTAMLGVLSEWKEESALTAAEHYREKSGAYTDLLNLAQNGPGRELVLKALLGYLKNNPFQATNRMEWFLPVNGLIGRAALDPALSKFAGELREADDPVIALYARVEALAPRPAERIMPLL